MRNLYLVTGLFVILSVSGCRALGLAPIACVDESDCPFDLNCDQSQQICTVERADVDGGPRPNEDAGQRDAGNVDAGNVDAGNVDAGNFDAGQRDAGNVDAGNVDAGNFDAGNVDAGNFDAGNVDAGNIDAGNIDAGNVDGGVLNGALAAWPLDQNGLDVVGPFDGTYIGDRFFAPGVNGDAVYFRGGALDCGRIGLLLSNSEKITFSAWIRDDNAAGFNILAQLGHPNTFPDFNTGSNLNRIFFDIGVDSDSFVAVDNYESVVSPGQWHHWTVVFDGAGATVAERSRIYIDGMMLPISLGDANAPTLTGDLSNLDFYISSPSGDGWVGFVDEARLFDRALTGEEIAGLAAEFDPPTPPGYRFLAPFEVDLNNVTDPTNSPVLGSPISGDNGVIGRNILLESENSVAYYPPFPWLNDLEGLSFSIWFRFNAGPSIERQFFAFYTATSQQIVFGIDQNDVLFFDLGLDGQAVAYLDNFSNVAPSLDWHHLAVVYDGTRNNQHRVKIYLDDVVLPVERSGNFGSETPDFSTVPMILSAEELIFDGALDEFSIYDRALTPEEVSQLANHRGP